MRPKIRPPFSWLGSHVYGAMFCYVCLSFVLGYNWMIFLNPHWFAMFISFFILGNWEVQLHFSSRYWWNHQFLQLWRFWDSTYGEGLVPWSLFNRLASARPTCHAAPQRGVVRPAPDVEEPCAIGLVKGKIFAGNHGLLPWKILGVSCTLWLWLPDRHGIDGP
jgi:hypothetical protein